MFLLDDIIAFFHCCLLVPCVVGIGISNALAEEKSRLDELIVKVDENYEGLVKDLKQLQEDLENLRDEIPDIGEAPPRITGEENELFFPAQHRHFPKSGLLSPQYLH